MRSLTNIAQLKFESIDWREIGIKAMVQSKVQDV